MAEDARSFVDRVAGNKGLNTIASIAEVLRHIAVCVDELKREVAALRKDQAAEVRQLDDQLSELEGNIKLYLARFSDHIQSTDRSFTRVDGDMNRLWGKVDGRPSHPTNGNGSTVLRLSLQGLIALAIVVAGIATLANPQFGAFLQWIVGVGKAGG